MKGKIFTFPFIFLCLQIRLLIRNVLFYRPSNPPYTTAIVLNTAFFVYCYFRRSFSLTGGLMMVKVVECRVIESRSPRFAAAAAGRVPSVEKPGPQSNLAQYDYLRRKPQAAGHGRMQGLYSAGGRLDSLMESVRRLDVLA